MPEDQELRELEADAIVLMRPVGSETSDESALASEAGSAELRGRGDDDNSDSADSRIWLNWREHNTDPTHLGLRRMATDIGPKRKTFWQRSSSSGLQQRQREELPRVHESPDDSPVKLISGRRKPLSVVIIHNGSLQKENFTASQLLRLVRNLSRDDDNGGGGALKLRDIRQICSGSKFGGQRPSIEPRRNCVVINMPKSVKALIVPNKVILISDVGPEHRRLETRQLPVPKAAVNLKSDKLQIIANSAAEPLLAGWHNSLEGPHDSPMLSPPMKHRTNSVPWFISSMEDAAPRLQGVASCGPRQRSPSHQMAISFNPEEEYGSEEGDPLIRKLLKISQLSGGGSDECASGASTMGPFEFLALECILFEVIRKLADDTEPACDVANRMKSTPLCSSSTLHQIQELKKLLQESATQAEGIAQCLTEVLASEEDIRRLELSRFCRCPQQWDEPGDSPGAEDVEILLESYQQDIQGMIQQIEDADEALDLTIQIMQLQLAGTRTVLLKIEIALQIISVVVGVVSAAGGIFGMNIRNGFEEREDIFWKMTSAMTTLVLVAMVAAGVVTRNLTL